jgi:hypothetical protein
MPHLADPWLLVLRENVAYLGNDERRQQAFGMLEQEVGTEPGAEGILLLCVNRELFGLESNALRVLRQLGYGRDHRNYSTMYKFVQASSRRSSRRTQHGESVLISFCAGTGKRLVGGRGRSARTVHWRRIALTIRRGSVVRERRPDSDF